jgi:putative endonuclease
MAAHNDLGKLGEDIASDYLSAKGFRILERNWRNRFEEIDIIAQKDDYLVIVEVKTRKNLNYGAPEGMVGLQQQRNLVNAADVYIKEKGSDLETRFDVIAIVGNASKHSIHHIPWAFSPFD